MGCGKSSVGRRLSYRLRMPFIDTDKLIERRAGKKIPEIFAQEGEAGFREREKSCLCSLLKERGRKIISTGGGLPLKEENRAVLKELGQVIYLRALPETIYGRLKHDTTRPLLQTEDPEKRIRELMAERASIYEAAADVIVDVDGKDFEEIMGEIRLLYHKWKRRNVRRR